MLFLPEIVYLPLEPLSNIAPFNISLTLEYPITPPIVVAVPVPDLVTTELPTTFLTELSEYPTTPPTQLTPVTVVSNFISLIVPVALAISPTIPPTRSFPNTSTFVASIVSTFLYEYKFPTNPPTRLLPVIVILSIFNFLISPLLNPNIPTSFSSGLFIVILLNVNIFPINVPQNLLLPTEICLNPFPVVNSVYSDSIEPFSFISP